METNGRSSVVKEKTSRLVPPPLSVSIQNMHVNSFVIFTKAKIKVFRQIKVKL